MRVAADLLRQLERSSDNRLERVISSNAIRRVRGAARRLQRVRGFQLALVPPGGPFPKHPLAGGFKYSHGGGGSLNEALEYSKRSRPVTISCVFHGRTIVGYGIAELMGAGRTDISIIDVSHSSRRSAGVSAGLTIDGEPFTVGVAHLVVMQLIDVSSRPVWTNATHDSSSYVFKSLGFVNRPETDDPGLLHLT